MANQRRITVSKTRILYAAAEELVGPSIIPEEVADLIAETFDYSDRKFFEAIGTERIAIEKSVPYVNVEVIG